MHPENVALRRTTERGLPLIWFVGVSQGLYLPRYPVYLIGEERAELQFVVALDDLQRQLPLVDEGVLDEHPALLCSNPAAAPASAALPRSARRGLPAPMCDAPLGMSCSRCGGRHRQPSPGTGQARPRPAPAPRRRRRALADRDPLAPHRPRHCCSCCWPEIDDDVRHGLQDMAGVSLTVPTAQALDPVGNDLSFAIGSFWTPPELQPPVSGRVGGAAVVGVAGWGGGGDLVGPSMALMMVTLRWARGRGCRVRTVRGRGERWTAVAPAQDVVDVPDGGGAERCPAGVLVAQPDACEPAGEAAGGWVAADDGVASGEQAAPPGVRASSARSSISPAGRGPWPGMIAGSVGLSGLSRLSSGTISCTSSGTWPASVCPVRRSTSRSASTWPRFADRPWALAVSPAWRSAARQATACSTGSSADSQAMVSGAGRQPTRRSLRAFTARTRLGGRIGDIGQPPSLRSSLLGRHRLHTGRGVLLVHLAAGVRVKVGGLGADQLRGVFAEAGRLPSRPGCAAAPAPGRGPG